ncbi:MAG: arsenic resistance N-acetyltransferase ArsN2 [Woeseiaceae bacterium]
MGDVKINANPPLDAAVALLREAGLPVADLTGAHMRDFFYYGQPSAPVALVGVEFCGPDALLRSLAVAPDRRARGIGSALVRHAENHARGRAVQAIYLLTTDAATFFERCGYETAERDSAPASIRATREFAEVCPGDSTLLVKRLAD